LQANHHEKGRVVASRETEVVREGGAWPNVGSTSTHISATSECSSGRKAG